jgi:hypothetical protein
MKNVTITLDEDTAALARVEAARRNVSLSRFVGELLRRNIRESREYDAAMRRFLNSKVEIRMNAGERYLTREEAHDRAGLRRR